MGLVVLALRSGSPHNLAMQPPPEVTKVLATSTGRMVLVVVALVLGFFALITLVQVVVGLASYALPVAVVGYLLWRWLAPQDDASPPSQPPGETPTP